MNAMLRYSAFLITNPGVLFSVFGTRYWVQSFTPAHAAAKANS